MKQFAFWALVLCGGCGGMLDPAGPAEGVRPAGGDLVISPGNTFAFGIAQGGRPVAVRGGQVSLRKAPFTIVLRFPHPDGVFINASTNRRLFDAARGGTPVSRILPIRSGIPEPPGNPQKSIVLTDKGYHYWCMFGQTAHKFEAVAHAKGSWVCRRTVANYAGQGRGGLRPISNFDGEAIYLVFVKTVRGQNHRRVETDKACLKIAFR